MRINDYSIKHVYVILTNGGFCLGDRTGGELAKIFDRATAAEAFGRDHLDGWEWQVLRVARDLVPYLTVSPS